jgi:hypothetical protein
MMGLSLNPKTWIRDDGRSPVEGYAGLFVDWNTVGMSWHGQVLQRINLYNSTGVRDKGQEETGNR